jgi:CDP-glucose 4,6-dehydratase
MSFEEFAPNLDRGKKVLVTGHTGFKGTWLTILLERLGFEVVGLSLPPAEESLYNALKRRGKIDETFTDITDSNSLQAAITRFKPAHIFHLAAQPLVLESYKDPKATFSTNVMGTVNLLDSLFRTDSSEGIVVCTTDKVYRNNDSGARFVEDDALKGKDPYSASKVGTESVVNAWQQIADISGGPQLCSVRAGNVIGGGDFASNRLMPDLIRSLMKKMPLEIRNLRSTRPWQHALDPLMGYILAMNALKSGSYSPAYNFGPNEGSLSVGDVVQIAKKELTSLEIAQSDFSDTRLEAKNLDLDSSLSKNQLNWRPAWTQEEAVVATALWWKGYLNDPSSAERLTNNDIEFRLNSV